MQLSVKFCYSKYKLHSLKIIIKLLLVMLQSFKVHDADVNNVHSKTHCEKSSLSSQNRFFFKLIEYNIFYSQL